VQHRRPLGEGTQGQRLQEVRGVDLQGKLRFVGQFAGPGPEPQVGGETDTEGLDILGEVEKEFRLHRRVENVAAEPLLRIDTAEDRRTVVYVEVVETEFRGVQGFGKVARRDTELPGVSRLYIRLRG
jgi:hypothetical protein